MAKFNNVSVTGNLTRDLVLRYTARGTAVTDMRIAVDAPPGEETVFINVRLWRDIAESACAELSKGSFVKVDGRLQLESWQDRKTKQQQSRLQIVAESLQMLSRNSSSKSQRRLPLQSPNEAYETATAGRLF
ncbi:MAG: single-stranded DNA-binding protein [Planctomycetota bacterium]|nr:single-stranded DNA-binding protein [Planctomycetota bacterium]